MIRWLLVFSILTAPLLTGCQKYELYHAYDTENKVLWLFKLNKETGQTEKMPVNFMSDQWSKIKAWNWPHVPMDEEEKSFLGAMTKEYKTMEDKK